jgi:outer membrane lipoprotein-sorting protein
MKIGSLVTAACAISCLTAGITATAAPTAQEILAKSRAAMKSMKTYQATVVTTMSGGPMSITLSARTKQAGNKTWAQLGMVQGSAQAQQNPLASMLQNMIIIDDGTNTWTYMPAMKQYRKGPAGGAKQFNLGEQFLGKVDTNANLTFGGAENVGGKPTWVVEAKPKKLQPGQTEVVRMNFDQSTYHLLQAKVNQSRPASAQSPARQQSVMVIVKDEKINQPIPESTFKFTPPAGAKEAQGGMGMGMPGGAGQRRN